jgi:hypothetical protein
MFRQKKTHPGSRGLKPRIRNRNTLQYLVSENLGALCGSETKGWFYIYRSDIVVTVQNIQNLEVRLYHWYGSTVQPGSFSFNFPERIQPRRLIKASVCL